MFLKENCLKFKIIKHGSTYTNDFKKLSWSIFRFENLYTTPGNHITEQTNSIRYQYVTIAQVINWEFYSRDCSYLKQTE